MKEILPNGSIKIDKTWNQSVLPGYEKEVAEMLNQNKLHTLEQFFTNPKGRVTAIKQDSKDLTAAILTARFSRANEQDSTEVYWQEFLKKTGEDVADRILNEYGDDSVREQDSGRIMVKGSSVLTSMQAFRHPLITGIEASTRYIDWGNLSVQDFAVYPENVMEDPEAREIYFDAIRTSYETYKILWPKVWEFVLKENPKKEGQSDFAHKKAIKGATCDVLRGLLPLGIKTSFGIHANYRSLSEVVMNLRASELRETREIAGEIEEELKKVNPVFMKVVGDSHGEAWTNYQKSVANTLKEIVGSKGKVLTQDNNSLKVEVEVLNKNWSKDILRAAILSKYGEYTNVKNDKLFREFLDDHSLKNFLIEIGKARTNRRHKLPDVFDPMILRVGIENVSFGSFKDINRHRRLLSKSEPDWTGNRGHVTPAVIERMDEQTKGLYKNVFEVLISAKRKLETKYPEESKLLLAHGTKTSFEMTMGLVEGFWVPELRSIPSGHEEYRVIAVETYKGLIKTAGMLKNLGTFVNEKQYDLGRIDEAIKADLKGSK